MDSGNFFDRNLLGRLEHVSSAASGRELSFREVIESGSDVEEIASFLGISPVQAVFFSCFTELSLQRTVTLETLSKHLRCSVLRLINCMNEFEALEKKGYLHKSFRKRGRKHTYTDMSFSVPHHVIEALRKADRSILESTSKYDLPGFLRQISDLVDDRSESQLTTSQLFAETEFLISNNRHLPFVSFVDDSLEHTVSKLTVFVFSFVRMKRRYVINISGFSDAVFEDLGEQLDFTQLVCSGKHELIRKNLLKLSTSEFDGEKMVFLSQHTTRQLYTDYPALLVNETENSGLISAKTIPEKKLFFSSDAGDKIASLTKALGVTKFRSYRRELKNNNLSGGVTAIFFGAPGTGKTEAVYQAAIKTRRDIMMVDLSETKSKWFGDSEKAVKKIFVDYSALLKSSQTEPILFINEADGLFTGRSTLGSRSSAADHAVNTIQNILLQSLENFEGILIATTNLSCNLDKAFERRFTFRIEFPMPDAGVRKRIWKSRLPELSDEEASKLGAQFGITGGEIEVQVRQALLSRVLNRKISLYETLTDNCSKDHGFSGRKMVGY